MSGSYSCAKACGFSFGRNLTKLNYPVEAAVRSVLPLCERFIFVAGKSEDDTRSRLERIDPRVEVLDSVWPDVKFDGTVLAIEANKAMAAAEATGCTWGFYIQADEVVHEDDLPGIRAALDYWAKQLEVKALLFRYLHFFLDYQTIDPWGYHKASRVVRLDGTCHMVGDACGPAIKVYRGRRRRFRDSGDRGYLDQHHLGGLVQWARDPRGGLLSPAARIFHYGAVKTLQELEAKLKMIEELWWGNLPQAEMERRRTERFSDPIQRYRILKRFRGSHPAVMQDRIAAHPVFAHTRSRWLCLDFYREILKHGFKG